MRFQSLPFPSALQEQQAHPHHHPQPARAHHRGRRRLHRLHPPDAVCGRPGPPTLQPIRRDQSMAPQGEPVAERPLPLLGSPRGPAAGLRCDDVKEKKKSPHKHPNEPIRTQFKWFFSLFQDAWPWRGEVEGREQASALRDLGPRSFRPLLPSSLSFSVYDRHWHSQDLRWNRTHLSVWKKEKKSPRQLHSACTWLQPNIPRQHPCSFARSLPPPQM